MGWAFVWLMVILKIPIAALLYIVWWAVKQTDAPETAPDQDGGVRPPHRPRIDGGRFPRRRGPHGAPASGAIPPRTRAPLTARARRTPRS